MRVVALVVCLGVAAGCTGATGPGDADEPVPVAAAEAAPLVAGESVEAALDRRGARRSHLVRVGEGQQVEVGMVAVDDGLDPYLRVYDADGELVTEDDDSGDGLNSLVGLSTSTPTTFTVEAASFIDSDAGRYRLEVAAVVDPRPPPAQVLLAEEGEVGTTSETATRFGFAAGAAEPLVIAVDVLGGDLDPVVTLLGPGGTQIGRDDDGGVGRNSRLEVRTRAGGQHVAVVTTFREGQTGRFRITVTTQRRQSTLDGDASGATDRPQPTPR